MDCWKSRHFELCVSNDTKNERFEVSAKPELDKSKNNHIHDNMSQSYSWPQKSCSNLSCSKRSNSTEKLKKMTKFALKEISSSQKVRI